MPIISKSRKRGQIDRYEDFRWGKRIQSGAIVSFRNVKNKGAFWIRLGTGSDISHVGIVIRVSSFGTGFGDTVLVCESCTLLKIKDFYRGECVSGVQFHLLSQRMDAVDGEVWLHELLDPLKPEELTRMGRWLRQTHNRKTPYDYSQAIQAGIDVLDWAGIGRAQEDMRKLFCSELVCKALQIAGRISDKINPSEQLPDDIVSMGGVFKKAVRLK